MASPLIIAIVITAAAGIIGYVMFRYVLRYPMRHRSLVRTLQRYDIDKSPSEIIREYHAHMNKEISESRIRQLERDYILNEPEQFLAMYDILIKKRS